MASHPHKHRKKKPKNKPKASVAPNPPLKPAGAVDSGEVMEVQALVPDPPKDTPLKAEEAKGAQVSEEGGNFFVRLGRFVKSCWVELKKVQWPNRSELIYMTGIVLGFVVIAGGYLGLLDLIFSKLIQALL